MNFERFLKKIFGPEGLFSSWAEVHTFEIGICETIAFWKPYHDVPAEYKANGFPLKEEYHYYAVGRACGIVFWLIVIPIEISIIVQIIR